MEGWGDDLHGSSTSLRDGIDHLPIPGGEITTGLHEKKRLPQCIGFGKRYIYAYILSYFTSNVNLGVLFY